MVQRFQEFRKLAVRDALLIAAAFLAWQGFAGATAGSGWQADLAGLLVGLAVGASAYLLHEWGHALGAMVTGSVLHAPSSLRSISLFSFDAKRNSRAQFTAMSLAGFAVTAGAVGFVYFVLPDGLLATRVARGAVMVLTSLTVLLEVPLLIAGWLRSELPPVETFAPPEETARSA